MYTVHDILGPEGLLVQNGREYRPGQHVLGTTCARCFAEKRPGMLEGPTGSGKTLAYLVPTIQSNRRVVIAARTNALLDQIGGEIRYLSGLMERAVTYAVLKGRRHYVCPHYAYKNRVYKTVEFYESGGFDLNHFPGTLTKREKRESTATKETCVKSCEFRGYKNEDGEWVQPQRCPYFLARDKAMRARIVVTNYDLLVMNFKLGGIIFGPVGAIVLDEAHEFNNAVREMERKTIGPSRFRRAVNRLRDLANHEGSERGLEVANELENATNELFDAVRQHALDYSMEPKGKPSEALFTQFRNLSDLAPALCRAAIRAFHMGQELHDPPSIDPVTGQQKDPRTDVRGHAELLAKRLFLTDDNLACWAYFNPKKQDALYDEDEDDDGEPNHPVSVRSMPIDVSKYIQQNVYDHCPLVIAISATLCPERGDFSYPRAQLAMPPSAIECMVDSPFDYRQQALWYTPTGMPKPASEGPDRDLYNQAASKIARQLVQMAGGRTLVLCSATIDLEVAGQALQGLGYTVLIQHQLSTGETSKLFKTEETSCLVASHTFGTGMDVRGPALICVIVWKLPFLPQNMVGRALEQQLGGAYWPKHRRPAMLITLKQWVGRLIRAPDDFGIIAILDSQVIEGRYTYIETAMPKGIPRTRSLEEVCEFLARRDVF